MTHGGQAPDPEEIRLLAREILARPDYAQWRESEAYLDVFQWLSEQIGWYLSLPDVDPALFWTIQVTLLLIAGFLVAHIVWSVRQALRASREDGSPEASRRAGERADLPAQAAKLAAADDYLQATHTLQLAVLEHLLERGTVRLARSEPNQTLRERLQHSRLEADLRDRLIHLIDRFETAWFRDRSGDARLYEDWRELYTRLRSRAA